MAVTDVYSVVRDEEALLPYFLRNYGFARRVVLYDDGSTDRTLEVAASDPRVEVRPLRWGCYREDALTELRNHAWRESDADFVVVADADELVWHPDLPGELERYRAAGVTLPDVAGFEMVGERGVPPDDGRQLWEHLPRGVYSPLYSKRAVFCPGAVDIRYEVGCHACDPRGRVVRGGHLKLLHYHFLGEAYTLGRWAGRRPRVDPRAEGLGWKTYREPDERVLHWQRDFQARAIDVIRPRNSGVDRDGVVGTLDGRHFPLPPGEHALLRHGDLAVTGRLDGPGRFLEVSEGYHRVRATPDGVTLDGGAVPARYREPGGFLWLRGGPGGPDGLAAVGHAGWLVSLARWPDRALSLIVEHPEHRAGAEGVLVAGANLR